MKTSKIKGLIFDVGGVLVDLDLDRCKKAFIKNLGYMDIDNLIDACHQKGFYSDFEEGKIDADEFRSRVLEGSRPGSDPADVDRSIRELLLGVESYKFALLKELKTEYKLYLLSNNNAISMPMCRSFFTEAGCPTSELFEKEFVSYQMKMLKPSAEIFAAVVEGTGFAADELLFIDDSPTNVEAGARAGLNTLLYPQGSDLRQAIEKKLEELGTC